MRSNAVHFQPGDVLYGRLRPYLNKVTSLEFEGLCSAEFIVFPRTCHLDSRFVQYFLNSSEFVSYASHLNEGDRPRVDYNQLAPYPVGLPPLPEQHRIVAEIEKQFTRLDAAVAALKRVQANAKRYRASVLKAACEGRLVPTEAELAKQEGRPYEPASELLARILTERRTRWEVDQLAKMKARGKPTRDDKWKAKYKGAVLPLGSAQLAPPLGWVAATIDQITQCLDSKRVPVSKKERAKRRGSVPYYGANGQVGWIDGPLFDEPLVLVVEDETFTGRQIPFSYKISGKAWVNNHAHVLRAITGCETDYLNCSLMHYPFTRLTTGTTGRRKLTQKALVEAPYFLPPLAEQHRIVAEVERRLSRLDALEAAVDHALKRAARLRQSILKRAFSGQLVPQDPNDEPASQLLERIHAERSVQEITKARRRVAVRRTKAAGR